MPFEFKNGTVLRLYGKDNLNNKYHHCLVCGLHQISMSPYFSCLGVGVWDRSHCYPVIIRLLVFLYDSLLMQPDFQAPGMGEATCERVSRVDGQPALTSHQAKADVPLALGIVVL